MFRIVRLGPFRKTARGCAERGAVPRAGADTAVAVARGHTANGPVLGSTGTAGWPVSTYRDGGPGFSDPVPMRTTNGPKR
ncbi:hypothetical protein GCM10028793_62750 [Nocardiopsis oceani]